MVGGTRGIRHPRSAVERVVLRHERDAPRLDEALVYEPGDERERVDRREDEGRYLQFKTHPYPHRKSWFIKWK